MERNAKIIKVRLWTPETGRYTKFIFRKDDNMWIEEKSGEKTNIPDLMAAEAIETLRMETWEHAIHFNVDGVEYIVATWNEYEQVIFGYPCVKA